MVVSMYLKAVWCEKILLVKVVAWLNPLACIYSGIARNPMPHLWRNSTVNTNIYILQGRSIKFEIMNFKKPNSMIQYYLLPTKQPAVTGSTCVDSLVGFYNLYSAYNIVHWEKINASYTIHVLSIDRYVISIPMEECIKSTPLWKNMNIYMVLSQKISDPLQQIIIKTSYPTCRCSKSKFTAVSQHHH